MFKKTIFTFIAFIYISFYMVSCGPNSAKRKVIDSAVDSLSVAYIKALQISEDSICEKNHDSLVAFYIDSLSQKIN